MSLLLYARKNRGYYFKTFEKSYIKTENIFQKSKRLPVYNLPIN